MDRRSVRIQPLRCVFSRWSRNPAAVFHSRRMVVNIGCLKANILDQIAKKTLSVTQSTEYTDSESMHLASDDYHPETTPLLELLETTLSVITLAYLRSQSSKSNIYNKENRTYHRVVDFCMLGSDGSGHLFHHQIS